MQNRYVDSGAYAFNTMVGRSPAPVSREQFAQTVKPQSVQAPLTYQPKPIGKNAGITEAVTGEDIDTSAPIEENWTEKDEYEARQKQDELKRIYGTQGGADEARRQKEVRKKARQEAKNVGVGEALIQGGISGPTLGVSDYIGGEEEIERKRAVQRAHPIAFGIGQLAGMIIPAVATEILTAGAAPTGEAAIARASALAAKFPKVFKAIGVAQKLPGIKQMKAARTAIQASKMPGWGKAAVDAAIVGGTLSAPHAVAGVALDTTRPLGERIGTGAMEIGIGAGASAVAAPVFGFIGKKLAGKSPEIFIGKNALGIKKGQHIKMVEMYGKENAHDFYATYAQYYRAAKGNAEKATSAMMKDASTAIKTMYDDVFTITGGQAPDVDAIYKTAVKPGMLKGKNKDYFMQEINAAVAEAKATGENPYMAVSRTVSEMKGDPEWRRAAVAFDNGIDAYIDQQAASSARGAKELVPQGVDVDLVKNRYKASKKAYAQAKTAEGYFTKAAAGKEFDEASATLMPTGNSDTELKLGIRDIASKILSPGAGAVGAAPGAMETGKDIATGRYEDIPADLLATGAGYIGGNLARRGMARFGVPAAQAASRALSSPVASTMAGQGARGLATEATAPKEDIADIRDEAIGAQPRTQDSASAAAPAEQEWYQKGRGYQFVQALALAKYRQLQSSGQLPEGYTLDMAIEDYAAVNGDQLKNNPRKYAAKLYTTDDEMKMFDKQMLEYNARQAALYEVDFDTLVGGGPAAMVHTGAKMNVAIDKAADALFAYDTVSKPGVTPTPAKKKMYEREIEAIVKSPTLSPEEKYAAIYAKFGSGDDSMLRNIGLTE